MKEILYITKEKIKVGDEEMIKCHESVKVIEAQKMFNPKFTTTHTITKALLDIERSRGFLDAANLKEAWITKMQSEALVLEAHHSTHIEGMQLTLAQASKNLRDNQKSSHKRPYGLREPRAS
jgi:Fic family protein